VDEGDPGCRGKAVQVGGPGGVGVDRHRAGRFVVGEAGRMAGLLHETDERRRLLRVLGPDQQLGGLRRVELLDGSLERQRALLDHQQVVADAIDLAEEVAGDEDGDALVGERAHQAAHLDDAGGVESVGRLVEDQQGWVGQQGGGDAEALLHPEGVALEGVAGTVGETDPLEGLVDPLGVDPADPRQDQQVGTARQRGVERGSLDEGPDPGQVAGRVGEGLAEHGPGAFCWPDQSEQHPDGCGLACPVGANEATDRARRDRDVQVVDDRAGPELLGQTARRNGKRAWRSSRHRDELRCLQAAKAPRTSGM
jgi:hypothetical protein